MAIGKTIRVYLADGVASGVIVAEIINWTGQVLSAPRAKLPDLVRREETKRVGLYILIGVDQESGKNIIYIGESDEVGKRLAQHHRDGSKEFWERTCVITSKDQNLTKAHIRYLESRLIGITEERGRAILDNSTAPELSHLPEAERADMEFFLDQTLIVLPVLSMDFARRIPDIHIKPSKEIVTFFTINSEKLGITARAAEIDGDFVVMKGSQARGSWVGDRSEKTNYWKLHDQLCEDGILVKFQNGDLLEFVKDHPFQNSSPAAAVIMGTSRSGPQTWKVNGTKKTYKTWKEEQLVEVEKEL